MNEQGPLADSYWAAVALVIFALTPFLVLTSGVSSLDEMIGRSLGLGEAALTMTTGMANAAYCFGTVLSIQLISRLPPRRLLVVLVVAFVVASVLCAWAPSAALFVAGRVVQGLTTSMMLIAAVPPLVTGWPKRRMRPTAVTMNLAIFGAVALGPVVGGVAVGLETWRTLFWIVAAVGLGAAIFFGVSELAAHAFGEPIVLVPLVAGVALVALLMVHQYAVEDPLMPVERLANTIPIAAILVAMCAAAASVGLVDLAQSALELQQLPRVFALIELLRGVAAFLAGPLLLHMSETVGASPSAGIEAAVWVVFGIAQVGGIVALGIWIAGRARLQRPDIEPWLEGEKPAISSPPLGRR